ncbi:MAG TPA: ROK family protein [Steroidobacteraceae bacterium]|nr:ROK family protein [Steroidobacteraceae bacterium]
MTSSARASAAEDRAAAPAGTRILAIDLGGTHVKVLLSGERSEREADSGPHMGPAQLVRTVRELTADWHYDVIAMGYPGVVWHGRPFTEPHNLAHGWVRFDYVKAFGYPLRMINDAAMQALGSYRGGRMLFLGLGTGLGAALILDGSVEATELAHLPYKKGRTYEDYLGKNGLERLGRKKWQRHVFDVTERLRAAFEVDYVVIGGGNAKRLKELPPGARLGDNRNAFKGAFRLWREAGWAQTLTAGAHRAQRRAARRTRPPR